VFDHGWADVAVRIGSWIYRRVAASPDVRPVVIR
jgi:predicted N-acyltransferase